MQKLRKCLIATGYNVTIMLSKFTISQAIWALNEVTHSGFNFGISGDGFLTVESMGSTTKTNVQFQMDFDLMENQDYDVFSKVHDMFVEYCKKSCPDIKLYTLA